MNPPRPRGTSLSKGISIPVKGCSVFIILVASFKMIFFCGGSFFNEMRRTVQSGRLTL